MFSSQLLLVAALAALHSFTLASEAPPPEITPAPTPTIDKRQVAGGTGTPVLSTLHYAYTNLPYQVYPYPVLRGPQYGFNQCNSTTLGDSSNCQTLIFNGPDDFCLWGSPDPSGLIGNVEAKVVAYCTKPYHGTRVIPPGSITGLQWTKTSAYIQVVGFISNAGIGLDPTDQGGELDPHGADLQGNPLGGVVFSNGTTDSDGTTLTQVYNWNTFVGGNQFCFKACYNSITSPDYCLNIYDLVGCDYNMPSSVQNGTFTECDGDLQDVVGIYSVNGQTSTWSMPATLTATPPYTPRVPASSNCKTYSSTDLLLAGSATTSGVAASATGKSGSVAGASGSKAATGSNPSSTSSSSSSSSAPAGIKVPFVSLALLLGGVIAGGMMVL
ncbi:hypothetical protein K443DRAFT_683675 [Laccaria amethystina LaAM-08-1]|uniref:Macrofage activating glycoprotein n=1 Tax=Laccaria amethystina LaAM-08-1 TaxID=1095629 RepID=A0A0C9XEG5_9AGAR|nr:hypothetical protein K443DRAFT_683675 [Laccaria amethystina LaAM-08-1]